MVFVHERNTWISGVFAAQGVIIIALGVAAPHIIIDLSWRWVYFITAIAAAFFLVGVFFFMPETRWPRSRAEMGKFRVSTFQKPVPDLSPQRVSHEKRVLPLSRPGLGRQTSPSFKARQSGERAGTPSSIHCARSFTLKSSSSQCSTAL